MDKTLIAVTEAMPNVIKNTHFHITLAGWPAAVTAIAVCIGSVAVYAIKVTHPEAQESSGAQEKMAPPKERPVFAAS